MVGNASTVSSRSFAQAWQIWLDSCFRLSSGYRSSNRWPQGQKTWFKNDSAKRNDAGILRKIYRTTAVATTTAVSVSEKIN